MCVAKVFGLLRFYQLVVIPLLQPKVRLHLVDPLLQTTAAQPTWPSEWDNMHESTMHESTMHESTVHESTMHEHHTLDCGREKVAS